MVPSIGSCGEIMATIFGINMIVIYITTMMIVDQKSFFFMAVTGRVGHVVTTDLSRIHSAV